MKDVFEELLRNVRDVSIVPIPGVFEVRGNKIEYSFPTKREGNTYDLDITNHCMGFVINQGNHKLYSPAVYAADVRELIILGASMKVMETRQDLEAVFLGTVPDIGSSLKYDITQNSVGTEGTTLVLGCETLTQGHSEVLTLPLLGLEGYLSAKQVD